ncbi:MAG TPA: hypothetical protein VM452_17350 [Caulifigura sp.]|nr:hypothetical protein [Caulifigura sp.]
MIYRDAPRRGQFSQLSRNVVPLREAVADEEHVDRLGLHRALPERMFVTVDRRLATCLSRLS